MDIVKTRVGMRTDDNGRSAVGETVWHDYYSTVRYVANVRSGPDVRDCDARNSSRDNDVGNYLGRQGVLGSGDASNLFFAGIAPPGYMFKNGVTLVEAVSQGKRGCDDYVDDVDGKVLDAVALNSEIGEFQAQRRVGFGTVRFGRAEAVQVDTSLCKLAVRCGDNGMRFNDACKERSDAGVLSTPFVFGRTTDSAHVARGSLRDEQGGTGSQSANDLLPVGGLVSEVRMDLGDGSHVGTNGGGLGVAGAAGDSGVKVGDRFGHRDIDVGAGRVVRGLNYERNKANRLRKKKMRQVVRQERAAVVCDADDELVKTFRARRIAENKLLELKCKYQLDRFSIVDAESIKKKELQQSWEQRRIVENELNIQKAKRRLELMAAQNVDALVERERVGVLRDTERGKVAIEKAYSSLSDGSSVTANGGFAKTVNSTISPGSSASNAEIRNMQKELLDVKAVVDKVTEMLLEGDLEAAKQVVLGCSVGDDCKTSYTLDSNGGIVGNFGDAVCGYNGDDGRFHVGECYDDY